MEDLFAIVGVVADALEQSRISYAVTGSIASSYYGRPRGSLDADFATQMSAAQADVLGRHLSDRFYVSPEGLREACLTHGMANVIHIGSGLKIDLSVLAPNEYYREVINRRREVCLPGSETAIWMVSPEDVVLMKLEWRKDTRPEQQLEDARGVLRASAGPLDWSYLRHWAERLNVVDDLDDLRRTTRG